MMALPLRAAACGLLGLMLTACGGKDDNALEPTPGSVQIACAPPGGEFERSCFLERSDTAEGLVLTVLQPDGGFRRLLVAEDGAGVTAADGADPVAVTRRSPTEIEVTIGGARYRLPAPLRAGGDA